MTYETIIVSKQDHVACVTINRPQAMNSFTNIMMAEFQHFWRAIAEDDDTHAVVLRAAPGRAFSTGADVKAALEPGGALFHDNIWTASDPGEKLGAKSNRCWKPVIAAVHGMCAGGGFYWINEADIVICSEDATFFDPHVTFGMVAALEPIGASYRMPYGEVMRMVLLGNDERIGAATALRIGLVSEVTANDALWDRAQALAALIAAKPPAAIQGTVRAVWESQDLPRVAAMQTAMKYCQLGNPLGTAQIDRAAIMGKAPSFTTR